MKRLILILICALAPGALIGLSQHKAEQQHVPPGLHKCTTDSDCEEKYGP